MTFAAGKRILLSRLALLAPLPLPFNGVVGWGEVAAFWLVVGLGLFRAHRGSLDVLPKWSLNLLGLVYLPILVLELRGVRGGEVLHPLAHLVLYTLAIKLFALRQEKEKWHAFLAIFFLFLASVGSSVHPAVLLYLVVFLAAAIHTLARFAGFEVLSRPGSAPVRHVRVPLSTVVSAMTFLVIVGAIPFFVLVPRIRQPYVFSRLGAADGRAEGGRFQDRASLDTAGQVRLSRAVALRFRYDGSTNVEEPRLRSTVYDLFDGAGWRRTPVEEQSIGRGPDGTFRVGDALAGLAGKTAQIPSLGAMEIWLRSGGQRHLVLPVETTRLQTSGWQLLIAADGTVSLPRQPAATVAYRVDLARRGGALALPLPRPAPTALDPGGLTPRIEALAAEVMGEGADWERAERLERHLRSRYAYSLELGTGGAGAPIERFLFETRRGYCEYFATAMVLMLRSQGIPARFVLGYLGAEKSRLEDYYIVRDSHAHAWSEAYFPERGWVLFDPSPAVAARGVGDGVRVFFSQAYDYLLFRWDRYVLTYSFTDQVGLVIRLRDAWRGWWERFRTERQALVGPSVPTPVPEERREPTPPKLEIDLGSWKLLPPTLAALLLGGWLWWRRRRFGASEAYRLLRRELGRRGDRPLPSTPPLEVARRLERRWPGAAPETARVLDFYLRESFGGEVLGQEEIRELRGALRVARRKLRRSA